jgi:hypothetical protein
VVRSGEERRYTDNGTNTDVCTCVEAGDGGGGVSEEWRGMVRSEQTTKKEGSKRIAVPV